MSDIFISYARDDRAMAAALASDLKAQGFSVWWDADFVAADDFYEVILEALRRAKAVIVVWTKASAKSRFVRDEARFALHFDKLVAVKEANLEIIEVPFGFQGQHTDPVTDRDQIVRALGKLGVQATGVPALLAPNSVGDSVDDVVAFLGTNPPDAQRQAALVRLKDLLAVPRDAPKAEKGLVKSLNMSNWQAFLSGLVLRVPNFQLTTQGTWTSVGLAVGFVLLIAVCSALVVQVGISVKDDAVPGVKFLSGWVAFFGFGLLTASSWWRFRQLVDQRNFMAAYVVGFIWFLLWVFTFYLGAAVIISEFQGEERWTRDLNVPLLTVDVCIGLFLAIRKIRSAR